MIRYSIPAASERCQLRLSVMYQCMTPVHRAEYVPRGRYVTFILTLSAQCKQRQEILGEGEGEGHVA